jgi:SAM-dependent methyltransferase
MYDLSDTMIQFSKQRIYSTLLGNTEEIPDFTQGLNESQFQDLTKLLRQHQIEIHQGSSESLKPIQNSSADIYLSNFVLNLVENPENMIREAYRVLKPHGELALSVLGDPAKSLYTSAVDTWVRTTKATQGVTVTGRTKNWLGGKEGVDLVKGLLVDAGFQDIKVSRMVVGLGVMGRGFGEDQFDWPMHKAEFREHGLMDAEVASGRKLVGDIFASQEVGIEGLIFHAKKS